MSEEYDFLKLNQKEAETLLRYVQLLKTVDGADKDVVEELEDDLSVLAMHLDAVNQREARGLEVATVEETSATSSEE